MRLVGLKQANTLSGQEMEDLAAWVTSEEEASAVEREIRSKPLDSPRISFSSPVYTTIFLARHLFEFGPGA